ncbi:MAG: GNAT family N-acetyltransferase [Acidimicrobiia bacterium]
MPAPETFTTDRLVARRIDRDDEAFLAAMFQDPNVNATLGGPRDAERTRETLDRMTGHWAQHGFGVWILRDRVTLEPVGWVGLHGTDVGGTGGVELLYAVASTRWREGLATEAGRAAIDVARDSLGFDELVCFTMVENIGSRRTMEGLGFVYEREVEHAGLPHVLMRRRLEQREGADRG